ncbi:class I SAM-dependent methyltransferase [Streptomyces sp. NPDC088762]|uniref:class I SAM-dependent methyltransferase n=1 Tax=Streptomyces sp. NPDC088762 TaxID=3365891 RepID=UPI00381E1890
MEVVLAFQHGGGILQHRDVGQLLNGQRGTAGEGVLGGHREHFGLGEQHGGLTSCASGADHDEEDSPVPSHSSGVRPCDAIPRDVATYDSIGARYAHTRRSDPRSGARIHQALGDAATVLNVGAGTGSYEPPHTVPAVESSPVVIAQRPSGSAPALEASAESIPLPDDSADAVMALLTVHHWSDLEAGVGGELRRIARQRIVILTFEHAVSRTFWLLEEYLPPAAPRSTPHGPTGSS